jgi:crotonobetainyl-CoA:carnitine CoA-transferase CaiB-like acyl-CoA transferase
MMRAFPPLIDGVGYAYWMVNQGKRLLLLDFRKPAGMKRLEALIRKADVLLEGFRPGTMEKLGLGYARLAKLNPRLIYCSLVGYDPAGPMARKAGHDLNFMAASGLLGLGDNRGEVSFPAAQLADTAGSVGAVIGILAALVERHKTRKGRRVVVPISTALRSLLVIPTGHMTAAGREPERGSMWWSGAHPFYNLYRTKDGGWLTVAGLEKVFTYALLEALGLAHLKDQAAEPEALRAELQRVFEGATRAEWEERLKGKDVCVMPVLSLAEAQRRAL